MKPLILDLKVRGIEGYMYALIKKFTASITLREDITTHGGFQKLFADNQR